jgi:diaminohydroxyphosphoribosylaminopyrimidine deaminase/5-amino-6-(5-phosphoribosylamino)uracil reductase
MGKGFGDNKNVQGVLTFEPLLMNHERYMRWALGLALKGEGFVEPNPLAGAVIVKNNRIIGKGFHQYFGGPHAEINAINSVKTPKQLKGATFYLTLEPCVHFGKTPPCAPAIVQTGIKKVVISTTDPNPLVKGKGMRFLNRHGVKVVQGILQEEVKNINRAFFKLHQKRLPYVVAKWAMTLDGKIATPKGESKWITSQKSRDYARRLRSKMRGIMVGINTVEKDNPTLLPQDPKFQIPNPARIILDSNARLPLNSNIIKTLLQGTVYLMVSSSAPKNKIRGLEQKGCQVFVVPKRGKYLNLVGILRILAEEGINKIMIEGGGEVLGSAFDNTLVDEVYVFIAPKIIGAEESKTPVEGKGIEKIIRALQLKNIEVKYLNPDVLVHGYL